MSQKNNESTLISFYKECLTNNYLDFDDEYQNFKINALAKKKEIIDEGESVTKEFFEQIRNLYEDKINKDRNEKELKRINEKKESLKSLLDSNTSLAFLDGKEKRKIELNKEINELQKTIDDIEKLKDILVDSYYSGSKQSHEDWFFKGLGTELATGSRALGSLAVAEANEKNRQIDEQNKQLKNQIYQKVHNDPGMNTSSIKKQLSRYKERLDHLETAFVSYSKNFFKYVGYKITDWELDNEVGYATVRGEYWLREIPKMPRNINASLDGSCKAVIYKKSDLSVLAEMLIPLPFFGLGLDEEKEFIGVQSGNWPESINKKDYGIELIDFNTCAIEEENVYIVEKKGNRNQNIADQLLFNDIRENIDYLSIESVNRAISEIENTDTNIDGKNDFLANAKETLKVLIAKKEEEDKKAEEKRIADEQIRITKEKEKKEKEKARKQIAIKTGIIIGVIFVLAAIIKGIYTTVIIPERNYQLAEEALKSGDFETAITIFEELQDYNDSVSMSQTAKLNYSEQLIKEGSYEKALEILNSITPSEDNAEKLNQYKNEATYLRAMETYEASYKKKDYVSALYSLKGITGDGFGSFIDEVDNKLFDLATKLEDLNNYTDAYQAISFISNQSLFDEATVSRIEFIGKLLEYSWNNELNKKLFKRLSTNEIKKELIGTWYMENTSPMVKKEFKETLTFKVGGGLEGEFATVVSTGQTWSASNDLLYFSFSRPNGDEVYQITDNIIALYFDFDDTDPDFLLFKKPIE